jgi:deglycase
MANELQGKKVAFIATEGVEQVELTAPWKAVEEAGAQPELISIDIAEFNAWNHFDKAGSFKPHKTAEEAQVDDYDALVLPGGVANPDQLRMDENAVNFVREFAQSGKPIGVICHGPWTLIEAGVVEGRTITSWPSLQTDLRNAGAKWVDQEVIVDRGLVSSRKPDDLPAFNAKLIEEFAEGRHEPAQRAQQAVDAEATPK